MEPQPTPSGPLPVPGSQPPTQTPLSQIEDVPYRQEFPRNIIKVHIVALVVSLFLSPLLERLLGSYQQAPVRYIPVIFIISMGLVSLFCYIKELSYIRKVLHKERLFIQHIVLLIGSLAPAIGASLGDQAGLANYHNGTTIGFVGFISVATAIFVVVLQLLSIGSLVQVGTKDTRGVLGILGQIAYVIIFLLIGAITFFAYSLFYSLHDPSTE
jgi:hypothetical protein